MVRLSCFTPTPPWPRGVSTLVPHRSRWSEWLLGRDEKLRLRTSRAALATFMMMCCTFFMYLLAENYGVAVQTIHWWALGAVGGLMAATLAIRTGLSRRWRDPSLTTFQMQWALTCNAAAYVIAGPARALLLPVMVIILMFGIFGRGPRQMLYLMAYSIVAYTGAVLVAARLFTPPLPNEIVLAHITIVLLSVTAATMMCLQVQRMRARLRQQNLDLQAALAQIRELAMRDTLTGLLNRRQMTELMQLEWHRGQRSGRPLVLVQLDIDHFKPVNDTHGHAAGDRALQAFARTVLATIRDSDVLARWGGEEFVMMLTDTSVDEACEMLERVRLAVADMEIPHAAGTFRVTVSAGLALHLRGDTVEHTLERADRALYNAKALGRNRVVVAPSGVRLAPSQVLSAQA